MESIVLMMPNVNDNNNAYGDKLNENDFQQPWRGYERAGLENQIS